MLSLMVYAGLVSAFFKLQDAADEVRVFGTWLLTLTAFAAISINRVLGTGLVVIDVLLFLFVGFMLYRATMKEGEALNKPALVALLVGAASIAGVYSIPAFRPGPGGDEYEVRVERACQANLKTLAGAVEMYLLDKGIVLRERKSLSPDVLALATALLADFQRVLKAGDYLQSERTCGTRTDEAPAYGKYTLEDRTTDFIPVCSAHGSLTQIQERRAARAKSQ